MHSPFVFQFILHILNNSSGIQPPETIEKLRKELLSDCTSLLIEDLGAGSRTQATKERTVKQLARSAVKPKKYGQLLHRMVTKYQPQTIIELGTSLGLTTSYLAIANPSAKVTTIEGSSSIQQVAIKNFNRLSINNIEALKGNFDSILPEVLKEMNRVDMAYIDGNHRLEPTLSYFLQFLKKAHNNTILVFDDIHWSAEMEEAWAQIKKHPSVRCTVDIFFLGFVFFKSEFKEVQHFTVRF